jgi:hypothetical protein
MAAASAGACGVLTRSKQQELQAQVDAGKAAAAGMQHQLDDLQQQVRQALELNGRQALHTQQRR